MTIGRGDVRAAGAPSSPPDASADVGEEVEGAHDRPAETPAYLPIGAAVLVIAALLALVATPVLMTWRLDALQSESDATTGRGHVLTDSLKTLFIDEIVLLEQVRRGDPHSGAHYRRVRALQDSAIASLGEVAPRIVNRPGIVGGSSRRRPSARTGAERTAFSRGRLNDPTTHYPRAW